MIRPDQVQGIHVIWGNPFIVAIGKFFPFNKILEFPVSSIEPIIDDMLNLLFFFSVN